MTSNEDERISTDEGYERIPPVQGKPILHRKIVPWIRQIDSRLYSTIRAVLTRALEMMETTESEA